MAELPFIFINRQSGLSAGRRLMVRSFFHINPAIAQKFLTLSFIDQRSYIVDFVKSIAQTWYLEVFQNEARNFLNTFLRTMKRLQVVSRCLVFL